MGAYWANGHTKNVSCELEGWCQTNQRAELQAVVYKFHEEERNLIIRSDSAYVVNGCNLHLATWKRQGWRKVDHADLWKQVDYLLNTRLSGSVIIQKLKGHATERDVQTGRVTRCDKEGNDCADRLARQGAAKHAIDPAKARYTRTRTALARDVQRMMIDIVHARNMVSRAGKIDTPIQVEDTESEAITVGDSGSSDGLLPMTPPGTPPSTSEEVIVVD